jgi:energy-coupling factor transporter transmembrane protein EcfT
MKFSKWYFNEYINTKETKEFIIYVSIFIFSQIVFTLTHIGLRINIKLLPITMLFSFIITFFFFLIVYLPYREYLEEKKNNENR